jgi:poly(3-hydroxybutyrate) depolymerase
LIFKKSFLIICAILVIFLLFNKFLISKKQVVSTEETSYPKENEKEKTYSACVDSIETSNYANRQLKFFLYIPEEVLNNKEKEHPLLVCVPGLSGNGETFAGQTFKDFAEKEGFVIIAPSFIRDKENWAEQRSYQYPSVWSGDALINIVYKVSEKYKIDISRYYLFGHSAGAQFVLRFAIWEPSLCVACAGYGSGGSVIPDEFNGVSFLLGIGEKDTERIGYAERFYDKAKDLGIDVELKWYGGGHSLNKTFVRDAMVFFKKVKDQNPW